MIKEIKNINLTVNQIILLLEFYRGSDPGNVSDTYEKDYDKLIRLDLIDNLQGVTTKGETYIRNIINTNI